MATTGNPVLYALRDLGTSISNISTAEAQRRRDELASTAEENTQRRALESLRLSGEQQLAKLGIEEAKTRFDISRGERQLGMEQQRVGLEGRRVQTEEQRTTDIASFQSGQLQHMQADLELKTLQEKNQQVLRVAQTNAAEAQRTLALTANKTEEEKLKAAMLVNETNAKLNATQVNLHGMMQSLMGGTNASESDKAFLASFLGNAEQKGFLTAESSLPYPIAQSLAKGFLELRGSVEKGDEAMARRLYTDIGVKMQQAGKSTEEIAEYFDFVQSYARDREGTTVKLRSIQDLAEQLRPALYAQKKITDPSKMPLKQKTEIDKALYDQARKLYDARAGGGIATPPPAETPPPSQPSTTPEAVLAPAAPRSGAEVAASLREAEQTVGGLVGRPRGDTRFNLEGLRREGQKTPQAGGLVSQTAAAFEQRLTDVPTHQRVGQANQMLGTSSLPDGRYIVPVESGAQWVMTVVRGKVAYLNRIAP